MAARDRHQTAQPAFHRSGRFWRATGIGGAVVAISILHYITSTQAILLHEIFQRLYYVPIVVAAVSGGAVAGLLTSLLSSALYLPHVVLDWHAWPVFEANQYGELLVFNVVAVVTGGLADRLRAERNRYQKTASELQAAYVRLEVQSEERRRADRLVAIGRVASGIAHEIRNPLAGLLGCLEILEVDFPRSHPKTEFFTIAKQEIQRLERVVTSFLDFAHPPTPASQIVDVGRVLHTTLRLAAPGLACRQVRVNVVESGEGLFAEADVDQVEQAILNVVLDGPALDGGRIEIRAAALDSTVRLSIEIQGVAWPLVPTLDLFEPFAGPASGKGLSLATARRLIENQHGAIWAERRDEGLRYVIDLPRAPARAGAPAPHATAS